MIRTYKYYYFIFIFLFMVLDADRTSASEVELNHFVGGFSLRGDRDISLKVSVLDEKAKKLCVIETHNNSCYVAYPFTKQQEIELQALFGWKLEDIQQLQCIQYDHQQLKEFEKQMLQDKHLTDLSIIESIVSVNPMSYRKIMCFGTANQLKFLGEFAPNSEDRYFYYDSVWGLETKVIRR